MRFRADQRLFLSYLLLILGIVVSLSVGAERILRRRLVGTVEDAVRRELALAREIYDTSQGAPPDSVAERLSSLNGRRVTLIAPDGRVVGESGYSAGGIPRMENHRSRPEVAAALGGRVGSDVRVSATLGISHLYLATPTARGEILRLAVPLSEIEAAVDRVQRGVLGVGALSLVLAAIVSLGFSVAITRPLRRIQAVARGMAAGDLSQRLRERRQDELGDLARAVDLLADELQRRLGQLEAERVETQTLIDSMSEGVLALTPTGALRRANPAARRMFSLPAEVSGIPPEAVARRPDYLRLVSRALAGEPVPAQELPGSERSLLATAHPLPGGGAVLVFLDVSELRRLEGVRREFVANASHELKTPLTAIRGYSETLLDPALPPELVRRFSTIVHQNAERLQRIVDDLLDLSRIESGGWRIEPEPVSVAEIAQAAWSDHAETAAERGVRFSLDVDPAAAAATADPGAVRQVLTNLLGNALRHTSSGGEISVRSRPARTPRWIALEVRDTGSGIPAVHLPRIFERFYRVDPARSRADGGTGLGLAIVKHLVEAHGGRVEAESLIGTGTTIRFTLPAA